MENKEPQFKKGDRKLDSGTRKIVWSDSPIRDNCGKWVGAYVVKTDEGKLISGILESQLTDVQTK